MAATFAFLKDVRPFKTAWRIQVKVIHSWRQNTENTGPTLELVLSDSMSKKIHASVKKDLVNKYVNRLTVGNWVFIETFSLSQASGQFRPTTHVYKMSFINGTMVIDSDPVSDASFLTLVKFKDIHSGLANPNIFVEVIGQIVSLGELEDLEAKNKPTKKLAFELRDETDERISCTLWGSLAEHVFTSCQDSDGSIIVCVLRFVKIKSYKGICFLTNSFDASQVHVNPLFHEVDVFRQAIPDDGLTLIHRQRQPRWGMVAVQDENAEDFPRRTIEELKNAFEIGKARIHCTIYAIDTDWAWYYISCRSCNKKVTHLHDGANGSNIKVKKPRFRCDTCNTVVTNVISRFMLYAKVMDNTGETKLLLFDSICTELIGQSAPSILNGSVDEISDPENLPDPVKSLIGKTYLFLVNVDKANIYDGKDNYKVSKVLLKDGLIEEQLLENSSEILNAPTTLSGDQGSLMLENSPQTTNSTTPSSKRVYSSDKGTDDQNSTSKKFCIEPIDLEKSNPEFGAVGVHEKAEISMDKDGLGKEKEANHGSVLANSVIEGKEKMVRVKIKVEKKE